MSVTPNSPRIAYLCDGKACNEGCEMCGQVICRHTFKQNHALYGICTDPGSTKERFEAVDGGDLGLIYWEKAKNGDLTDENEEVIW